jgi:hypothetical protein
MLALSPTSSWKMSFKPLSKSHNQKLQLSLLIFKLAIIYLHMTKISAWIEEARVSLLESALKRIDFKAAPSNLFKSIQSSFMHMGIYIDAEKEGFLKKIENLIKNLHYNQDESVRNSIEQLILEFLVKKIR